MEQQAKYMNLNEFLQTFFAAQDAKEDRIYYFPNMVQENKDLARLYDIIRGFAQSLEPNSAKLFKQYWDARNDNSPEAQDFLNMVKTITVWYSDRDKRSNPLTDYYNVVKHLIQNGKIKNQNFAVRLLQAIEGEAHDPKLKFEIKRLIAMNPAANASNVYGYVTALRNFGIPIDKNTISDLVKILDDQMVKTNEIIDREVRKDVPDIQKIQASGAMTLPILAEQLRDIMNKMLRNGEVTPDDVKTMGAFVEKLKQEYSIENILNTAPKNYTKEFEYQASLKLSQMEGQYEKMERDLESAQTSQRKMRDAYDAQNQQIRELQDRIAELEHELGIEKSKNSTMRGTINTFIMESENRANGSIVNKGKDLAAQIANLKRHFQAEK